MNAFENKLLVNNILQRGLETHSFEPSPLERAG
jgi:hypothetical protein